jgi:hypothetical protein
MDLAPALGVELVVRLVVAAGLTAGARLVVAEVGVAVAAR